MASNDELYQPPAYYDKDYQLEAEEVTEISYDAGNGVTVVAVKPPKGRGPVQFVILVDGVAQLPLYSTIQGAIAAADQIASSRREPPSDEDEQSITRRKGY